MTTEGSDPESESEASAFSFSSVLDPPPIRVRRGVGFEEGSKNGDVPPKRVSPPKLEDERRPPPEKDDNASGKEESSTSAQYIVYIVIGVILLVSLGLIYLYIMHAPPPPPLEMATRDGMVKDNYDNYDNYDDPRDSESKTKNSIPRKRDTKKEIPQIEDSVWDKPARHFDPLFTLQV